MTGGPSPPRAPPATGVPALFWRNCQLRRGDGGSRGATDRRHDIAGADDFLRSEHVVQLTAVDVPLYTTVEMLCLHVRVAMRFARMSAVTGEPLAPDAAAEGGTGGDVPPPIEIPCVWFFLPVPHPLGLPTGWRGQRVRSPLETAALDRPTSGVISSLKVHQVDPSRQPVIADLLDLSEFAAVTMADFIPGSHLPDDEAGSRLRHELEQQAAPLRTTRTVFEVAVEVTDHSEAAVSNALDEAIDHVRHVQRAVSVATEWPVRLIARSTLPPFVPTFGGRLRLTPPGEQPGNPIVSERIVHPIDRSAPPSALGLAPEPFGEELLDGVREAADQFARLGPFQTYADIRREALVQRHFDGNHRLAVVSLATAGEVLLDSALLHMLWEEHVEPAEAARYFDRGVGHSSRVARNFPQRLGGGWDAESGSPAGRYLQDLVRLRHRVVHAGHEPTDSELNAAWQALFDLEHFLGDRLASERNLKRYTRTALAWMGDRRLEQRGRLTNHVRRLTEDASEPNWIDSFARYRLNVDKALDPTQSAEVSPPEQLVLYVERRPDGSLRWVIHDPRSLRAAEVDGAEIRDAPGTARVHALLAAAEEGPDPKRAAMMLDAAVPPRVAWLPDHELFPELTIFPGTRTPGPDAAPR